VGPAVASALLFACGVRPWLARAGLVVLGILVALSDVLLVRTFFGQVYVGLVAAVVVGAALKLPAPRARWFALLLAVRLGQTVLTRADYVFTSTAHTGSGDHPSDVSQIAQALGGPFWLWGIICGAVSVAVLWGGTWFFVRVNTGAPAAVEKG